MAIESTINIPVSIAAGAGAIATPVSIAFGSIGGLGGSISPFAETPMPGCQVAPGLARDPVNTNKARSLMLVAIGSRPDRERENERDCESDQRPRFHLHLICGSSCPRKSPLAAFACRDSWVTLGSMESRTGSSDS